MWSFFGSQNSLYCCLDIGTESVKALIFTTEKKFEKCVILGWGKSYFDKFDISGFSDFNDQILEKSIIEAMNQAKANSCFSSASREIKSLITDQKKWKVLIGLSPTILKARVESITHNRKKAKGKISGSEANKIFNFVFKEAKNKIELEYCRETGILRDSMEWIAQKIINFKIDGYKVEKINGYDGINLDFKVLVTFLPKSYYEKILKIATKLDLGVIGLVNASQGINAFLKEKKGDGLYIDIGGDATQIIGVANGKIEKISEFEEGVSSFAEKISLSLGLDKFSAHNMVENYSEKKLGSDLEVRLKEIFSTEKLRWYEEFKKDLKKSFKDIGYPAVFHFFGGGAAMPEFKFVLQEKGGKDFEKVLTMDYLDIRSFDMESLELFDNRTRDFRNLQFMPSLLMCYNFIKEQKIKRDNLV